MICYLIKNKINNKRYVGITEITLSKRLKEHYYKYKREDTVFYKAIRKYGIDSFELEWFFDYSNQINSREELEEIETYFIEYYKTWVYFDNSLGYNVKYSMRGSSGGVNPKGVVQYSIDNLKKINEFKSISDASRNTETPISAISRCCSGIGKSANGFVWKYQGEQPKKYFKDLGKKVFQYDQKTLELISEYSSAIEAEKLTGLSRKNISQCCNNDIKSCGGFVWCFEGDHPTKPINNRKVKIIQLDKVTLKKLKLFESIADASKDVKVDSSSITKCCRGKKNSAGGFKWKYENIG